MRVLYLDIDTLRADHVGCYGYHRNTTPNIDRIAERGVRFNNAYCCDAPCLPSRTALMSGQHGIHTGVVGHGGTAADFRVQGESREFRTALDEECTPRIFRDAGMKTVLISPFAERHAIYTFYAGFNEMHNTGKGGMESAEEVTPLVLDWLERNAEDDNWYLHINYWDPHTPYRAPESYGNPFENDPLPEWLTEDVLERHQDKVGPHCVHEIAMWDDRTDPDYPRYPGHLHTMDELRQMIDGYDIGIKYADDQIGLILDALEKAGVLEDTAIIISADHGENQGELGIYGEHGTADRGTCHIPMIIKWPGCKEGHVDDGLHYNIDLPPTYAELLGQEAKEAWDGTSIASAIMDGDDCGHPYLVIGQCAHVCQRSVRFGPWLYMRTYHDGFHLFPDELLFNLEDDPYEQHNLAEERRDICMEAVYHLTDWHDRMMATMRFGYDTDPLWTVIREGGPLHARGELSTYVKRLEATGRGKYVPELKRRHPQEFA